MRDYVQYVYKCPDCGKTDGYEKVEGIIRCLCHSHLRRYYLDAIPLDSSKKEIPGSGGAIGRDYCDKLFKLERKWKKLTPQVRKKNRLIYSVPVLEAFFAWAEETMEYLTVWIFHTNLINGIRK